MRLSPDVRSVFRRLLRKGLTVTGIAFLFDTTRQTVHRWLRRGRHVGRESFKDKPREPRASKVTGEVELSILALRRAFGWGTARIRQGLINLPPFIWEVTRCVQGVMLSREAINNVLTRHGINGYPCKHKRWKSFRANESNELRQIDFKGPFTVQGKKYGFLICIDDYSRFLVSAEQFNHEPRTKEVTAILEKQNRLPKAILSDHGPQFKEKWRKWCRQHGIETNLAHPSHPQDKGKVERCIQNLKREFVNHLRKFPEWLKGKLNEYREWFNHSRFHRGINTFPGELYQCNVGNLTFFV